MNGSTTLNSEQQVKNGLFPFGEKNDKYAQSFVGQSYLSMLAANPDIPVAVANVSFEPGCRNNWHVHTDGYQILLAVAGKGWYQEEGQPVRALKPGDVVITPRGVKNWHGATKDSWFSHVAITAGATEFFEAVPMADYDALPG